MAAKLSPARKRLLHDDGYVVVPAAVPPKAAASVVREINNRLGTGEHPDRDALADRKDHLSEHVGTPAVLALSEGAVRELAESLHGPLEPLTKGEISLRFPARSDADVYEPFQAAPQPGFALCAGVFLSDVPKPDMGNLTVYPGTHLDAAPALAPAPVQLTGMTGDVVLFHPRLAHDKARNLSPYIRRMAFFRFRSARGA